MRRVRGDDLLRLPVRLHGIQLGLPVDLLLDRQDLHAVGLDVLCGDEVHRFLPLSAASVREDEIAIASPLVLLEEDELAFYRARALSIGAARGRPVDRAGRRVGTLRDVGLGADGSLETVVVETDGREESVRVDGSVRLHPASRSAA